MFFQLSYMIKIYKHISTNINITLILMLSNSLSGILGIAGDCMNQVVVAGADRMLSISSGQRFGLLLNHGPQRILDILA